MAKKKFFIKKWYFWASVLLNWILGIIFAIGEMNLIDYVASFVGSFIIIFLLYLIVWFVIRIFKLIFKKKSKQ